MFIQTQGCRKCILIAGKNVVMRLRPACRLVPGQCSCWGQCAVKSRCSAYASAVECQH
jgi:hypothetical protein